MSLVSVRRWPEGVVVAQRRRTVARAQWIRQVLRHRMTVFMGKRLLALGLFIYWLDADFNYRFVVNFGIARSDFCVIKTVHICRRVMQK